MRVVRVAHGKETAGLGVQAEEKAVEQHQRVVEGLVESLTRTGVVLEQAVGDQRHRGEYLTLERVAHLNGVGPALLPRPVEQGLARGIRPQRARGEEERKEAERLGVLPLEQGHEVDLEARALDEIAGRAVEAPETTVGQQPPRSPRDRQVVDDLGHGVFGQRSCGAPPIERPVEALRVRHADSVLEAGDAGESVCFGSTPIVEEQRIVRLPAPGSQRDIGLHRVGEPEGAQHRLDESFLGLGLVGRSESGTLRKPELTQLLEELLDRSRPKLGPVGK